jgi:hypothetical protein
MTEFKVGDRVRVAAATYAGRFGVILRVRQDSDQNVFGSYVRLDPDPTASTQEVYFPFRPDELDSVSPP